MSDPNGASKDTNSPLDEETQSRIDRTVRRFRRALEATADRPDAADLADYLSKENEPFRIVLLEQLISTDIEIRYTRGQKPKVEEYLQRFEELPKGHLVSVSLLVAEFNARKLTGEVVDRENFKARFPEAYPRFLKSLASHEFRTMDSGNYDSMPLTNTANRSMGFSGTSSQFTTAGYQIGKPIGQGSYGEVWQAEAPGGVDVAIKVVNRPLTDDGYRREHEALELVKRLRHPFLLQTHAFWSEPERLIVATELADCSLRDRLRACEAAGQTGIPLEELMGYMRESASALDFLRERDIMHRDIKPENILIVNGHAKVADFGIARAMPKNAPAAPTKNPGEASNLQATMIGTPHFMPPEVWQSSFSKSLDQYSLAIAYVQLRTGKEPFSGTNLNMLMFGHMTKAPKLEGLAEKEKAVVTRALSKNPDDRYPTCTAFVDALELATGLRKENRLARWPFFAAAGVVAAIFVALWTNRWMHRWEYDINMAPVVEIAAGSTTPVELSIHRNPPAAPAKIIVEGLPKGVECPELEIAPTATQATLRFTAADLNLVDSKPITGKATIHIERGGISRDKQLNITVVQPLFVGRELFEPIEGAKFERAPAGDRIFCTAVRLKDGSKSNGKPVVFRLARVGADGYFYMMETKVWNGLFEQFAKTHPEMDKKSKWRDGALANKKHLGVANRQLPVFSVTALEAAKFADWLVPNGVLPTTQQWRAAAFAPDAPSENRDGGPFDPHWNPNLSDAFERIGLNRAQKGPLPVGSGTADVTRQGFRDMAGNGAEWTRDGLRDQAQSGQGRRFLLAKDTALSTGDEISQIGRSFTNSRPLTYEDIPKGLRLPWSEADPETSFRVVWEP